MSRSIVVARCTRFRVRHARVDLISERFFIFYEILLDPLSRECISIWGLQDFQKIKRKIKWNFF